MIEDGINDQIAESANDVVMFADAVEPCASAMADVALGSGAGLQKVRIILSCVKAMQEEAA